MNKKELTKLKRNRTLQQKKEVKSMKEFERVQANLDRIEFELQIGGVKLDRV